MNSDNSFGQNQWLVDDMYQQFTKDPESVDKEWREFFEKNGAPESSAGTEPSGAHKGTNSNTAAN